MADQKMLDSLNAGSIQSGYGSISSTDRALAAEERLLKLRQQSLKYKQEEMKLDLEATKAAQEKLKLQELELKKTEMIERLKADGKSEADAVSAATKSTNDEYNKWKKGIDKKYKYITQLELKLVEDKAKADAKIKSKERSAAVSEALSSHSISKIFKAMQASGITTDADGNATGYSTKQAILSSLSGLSDTLASYTQKLSGDIENIAGMKTTIDTRLQGASTNWTTLNSDITSKVGMNPYVQQSKINENLASMVKSGIAYNVEQRAFLQTIKEEIADTFDANNGVLLRLVRIQSKDSTAARLGMESALTTYLNKMYENTEYLNSVSNSVKESLNEAMSLMSAEDSVSFEYQIQKWLGSLYSNGASDVSGLSSAIGQLSSGDISGLTGSSTGNLLIMAANKAGLSLSDILANGLTSSSADTLMSAMVSYMGSLYNQAGGNKLLQTQLASVYGLKASDLLAASKLSTSSIYGNSLSYNDALSQLGYMGSTIGQRISMGQMLNNLKGNMTYSLASGIANSPALYAMYEMSNLLDSVAGGMEFSIPLVMGSGSAQTFNVSNILKSAALGGSILGGIGDMLGGLTKSGTELMSSFGISTGSGSYRGLSSGVSESGYTGNSNGGDVYNSTMTGQTDETNAQTASAQDTSSETTLSTVDQSVQSIYNLLSNLVEGNCLRVTSSGIGV